MAGDESPAYDSVVDYIRKDWLPRSATYLEAHRDQVRAMADEYGIDADIVDTVYDKLRNRETERLPADVLEEFSPLIPRITAEDPALGSGLVTDGTGLSLDEHDLDPRYTSAD